MAPSASNNFEVRDDRRRRCQPVHILVELSRQAYVAALVGDRVATLADDAMTRAYERNAQPRDYDADIVKVSSKANIR
jgi:hypothetical protein